MNNSRSSGWCSSSTKPSSFASGSQKKPRRNIQKEPRIKIEKISSSCFLPLELITQVLIRLPVESVWRFGRVSNQWFDLISSASFKDLYAKHNLFQDQPPNKLLLWDDFKDFKNRTQCLQLQVIDLTKKRKNEDVISEFEYHKVPLVEKVFENFSLSVHQLDYYYASSCHGLICFADRLSTLEVRVLNPITKQDFKIQLPEHHEDPKWTRRKISIGFLPSTQEFKIVCWATAGKLVYDQNFWGIFELGCDILTFANKTAAADTSSKIVEHEFSPSWTSTMRRVHFDHKFSILDVISICISGVIYWPVVLENRKVVAVLAFDLEKEEGKIIPGPDDFPLPLNPQVSFIELRGFLCIVGKERYESTATSIWMLMKKKWGPDDHASDLWHKLVSDVDTNRPVPNSTTTQVVFLNVESRKFHYLQVHNKNKRQRLYRRRKKKKKSIQIFGDDSWREVNNLALIPNSFNEERTNTVLFYESLASLN